MREIGFFRTIIVPIAICSLCVLPASYMAWKEYTIQKDIVKSSLSGNPVAIEILIKYEKPWKLDETIIYEAIAGNKYAIQVLGIDVSNK